MGYYSYQNGLIYRHLNQDGGWDGHLQKCRSYILEAVEKLHPGKVTVLGSGWLLDLPLAEMSERTGRVILADIIHPPEVAKQIKDLKNVELAEVDVTGGLIETVWNKVNERSFFNRLRSVKEIPVPLYRPADDPGLVISLNILTQLETLVSDLLVKKARIEEEELTAFRSEIQKKHISFLSEHQSVLITDVEEVFFSSSGETEIVKTLKTGIPEGTDLREWTWGFDLKGSDYNNLKSRMKVIAVTYGG
jgi:hypothetical protein